ncbi:uncharacterized protein BDW43DRAFT_259924 [Aspergillus alliaceus]|nr:uncharacterized protein BDW43DRAFT_259924 [Aspergillus alliaceus]KAB8238845.1 hypothetical protein BDW43DRAFT_259924 [Aspergillus alliaceus]
MVPGTSNLVDDIFKSMGMDNLAKLNHWKDEQKFDEGDSTATANEPQNNNIVYSDSHGKKQTNESELSNPADDPSAFVSDLFTLLASRFKEAVHSSDEHTLS